MKLIKSYIIFTTSLLFVSMASVAFANEVILKTNKPTRITYQVAYQKTGGQPVLSNTQAIDVNHSEVLTIDNLKDYDLTGIVVTSVDGHDLPANASQFDKAENCSMTTDKTHTSGTLEFNIGAHQATCSIRGGLFGN